MTKRDGPATLARPSIRAVFFLMLLIAVAAPLVGLFFFRVFENQLIRKTEAELIAQSAAIAAIYRREVKAAGVAADSLGAVAPEEVRAGYEAVFSPFGASLDLARDPVLPPRPEGRPAAKAAQPYLALGADLAPVIQETRRRTLAAIQLLDPFGTVLTGRDAGLSLAHVPEVAAALGGVLTRTLRTRLRERPTPLIYAVTKGASLRVFVAFPVLVDGRVAGAVYASRTPAHMLQMAWAERRSLAFAAAASFAAVLLFAFLGARTVTGPLRALAERTRRIAGGDRAAMAPLPRPGTQEIAELSEIFLRTSARLHDRSASTAAFAAHVSHELKSPLTAIQGAAELVRDAEAMNEADRRRFLDNIVSDAERMTALVRRLLELARAETDSAAGASTVRAAAAELATDLTLDIAGDTDVDLAIPFDKLSAILGNLADNAARHGAGRLTIETTTDRAAKASDPPPGASQTQGAAVVAGAGVAGGRPTATIRVADDGAGVSAANRDKIFDPFFTTRRSDGGTGMGLAICRALIEAHGGAIALSPEDGPAVFTLTLPLAR